MERIVQVMDKDPDVEDIMKMWKNFNIPDEVWLEN